MNDTQKIPTEEQPSILLYDPVTYHKVLVSEEELMRSPNEYYSYKIYEGIGTNPSVGDWLKKKQQEEDH